MEFDLPSPPHATRTADLVAQYMMMTKDIMPNFARTTHAHWPVHNDHCFQRIALDVICGGVWYDRVPRPAYKNLTHDQARRAVKVCHQIIEGAVDINALNTRSLVWRGKTCLGYGDHPMDALSPTTTLTG